MKRLLLALTLALAIAFSAAPGSASAAAAYTTAFAVSITFQNVGPSEAAVTFDFFPENSGAAINVPMSNKLASNASNSLSISSVSQISGSFKGSAVLSSDQPVIATIVQFASAATGVKNRPLSNGFSATDASTKQLVATVLKSSGGYSTYFSVQNTETSPIDVTVDFYAAGQTAKTATANAAGLPANAAKYFDVKDIAALPAGFSGSAIVTAKITGSTTDAKTVVTVDELSVTDGGSKSFEGAATSGAKVFMPTAACKAPSGTNTVNSAFAIQNADTTNPVTFVVDYYVSGQLTATDGPFTISAGGKQSVLGCTKLAAGSNGSAVIRRTDGSGTLVAVGKINGTNLSVTSAFLGVVENQGSAKIALPYVRFSPQAQFTTGSRQRAFIAVQNIGTADATNVQVQYIDKDGQVKGTENLGTIAAGAKKSSSAQSANALDSCGRFGEYDAAGAAACSGGVFGGGAIVTAASGAQLAVIVRVQSGPTAGEDYNGINIQ
jgi:hypothetical protein